MKSVSLSGSPRASVGKKDAKAVRLSGQVPCVIYGGKEQAFFNLQTIELEKVLNSPEVYCFNLKLDNSEHKAILQEIQYHPINDSVTHIDFLEVIPGKEITVALPIKLHGNSEGVKAGGKLSKGLRNLKVRGLLENLPDNIAVDITNLNIGDSVKVKDISIPNVKVLEAPNVAVARVTITRNVQANPAAEAAKAAAPAAPAKAAPAAKK